ncbi:MAG: hypothetical protein LBR10_05915, partial [Prevotellaceae bacterium]|nr:hypothetical protein [Prevotellaceae bacterium]
FLNLLKHPIVLLMFVGSLGLIYDSIANFADMSVKDLIKSILFVIMSFLATYVYSEGVEESQK